MRQSRFLLIVIIIVSFFTNCKKSSSQGTNPPVDPRAFYSWNTFVMGSDLSYVNQVQDYGGVFKDSGLAKDPFTIFKNHGNNLVRVRLWHNPVWLKALNGGKMYSDLYDVEKTIQRAKNAGMAVNLDLHYSDTWADPGNQTIPAAWSSLTLTVLKDSVYNYTLAVLNYLKGKNLAPEMIQIGNETNSGMCWPLGKTSGSNFTSFALLLNSGIKAVRDFSVTSSIKPQIILHVAQIQNAGFWLANITAAGVTDYDVIGLSNYSKWSTVNAMADIKSNIINFKATYNKKVMIVETGYPFTTQSADSYNNLIDAAAAVPGYAITAEGQFNYMKDLTQAVISAGGSGVMYWEPAWISTSMHDLWGTGSSWENMTLFDFSGNALKGMDYMTYKYNF